MRITNVGLYSTNYSDPDEEAAYDEIITFSLRSSDPSARYMVRTIIGLDAEEIVPKFYGFSLYSKSKFYDFAMKSREIVMRIVLNPNFRVDESYSDVRDELYRAISATRTGAIMLHFNSGATTVARIAGFITKFEVAYFNELPEVQFTIRCDDPMFRAINPVKMYSNELSNTNPVSIPDSLSTAPHGFKCQLTFTTTSASFTIQDVPTSPEWKFNVMPSGGFLTGDILHFSSDYSDKYLWLLRGAEIIYLVDRIEPSSIWPILFPGINRLHFVDIAKFNWNVLEYYAAYWGV